MSSDDAKGGRGLLSKVARFVLNPTVDWSELDNRMPGTGTEQDRQAIKAAIERKRRNDFVRQREFDRLRAIMRQRRRPSEAPAEAAAGAFFESTSPGPEPSVEPTIEKIARIEEQMAQHWWKDGEGGPAAAQGVRVGGTVPLRPGEGALTPSDHLQAVRADSGWDLDGAGAATLPAGGGDASGRRAAFFEAQTVPADMLPHADGAEAARGGEAALDGLGATMADCTPAIEEAAIRFANGEDLQAEQGLRAATVVETHPAAARLAWLALLDLDRALGRREAFEADAGTYAERFGGLPPEWGAAGAAAALRPLDIPVLTDDRSAAATAPAGAAAARWACPVVLDVAAVDALRQAVPEGVVQVTVDWSALAAADLPAAQALLELVQAWSARELSCRFVGAAVLRRRLKASTPSGRRENDPLWWQLRLAVLRLMGRFDEFELTALDFCVTYGVVPPAWEAPLSHYESLEQAPEPALPTAGMPLVAEPLQPLVTELAGLQVDEWPAVDTTAADIEPATMGHQGARAARLEGLVLGDARVLLGALDAALADLPPQATFVIDCSALARIDFVAAGSLLQWILERLAQGRRIELAGVSRLVAAFFHVVGLDEAVAVRLRDY